jgi:hypothetical protein
MIVEQSNGYQDVQVTIRKTETFLANGSYPGDTFYQRGESVSLTETDRKILIAAFSQGLPEAHQKSWALSNGLTFSINGKANGNVGDWSISKPTVSKITRKPIGIEFLIQGSFHFEEMEEALKG